MTTFITGATGTVGGQLARELTRREVTLRLGTRRPSSPAAAALEELGAEIVELDLGRPQELDRAFSGVRRLFLVGPDGERFGDEIPAILSAAERAGVEFVLRLSALGASPDSPVPLGRQHGRAERHLAQSGLAWTVLQPTFFQDNLVHYQGDAIRSQGAFYGASGQGRTSYVSSADIARVAAEILTAPEPHHGQTYVLTGPDALSDREVAALATEALGREIRYVDLSPDALAAGMRDAGMPDFFVESLVALEAVKRGGFAESVSPSVETITGAAPEPLRDFLARNHDKLR